ncbi:MAG: hypothetical protein PHW22_05175 [Bacilli bacterium]|nr:hypothetical protein [Bacilli bacterium]
MDFINRKMKISDLILWDENARFPDKYFNSNEKELINYFLSKPDFKIKQLIEAIVKDFQYPQIEKLVVWNDDENYVVLEGNRRLTAYKLLIDKDLTDDSELKRFLIAQNSKISIDENFELECLITKDRNEGFVYIDRKHANNNNEVNWQDVERANYNVRRGSSNQIELLKIGISKIVSNLDLPDGMKEQVLGKNYVTTFFRIVTSTSAKRKYGYEILEDGQLKVKNEKFPEELKVIVHQVLMKQDSEGNKVDSRSLNKKEKIEEFIQSVDSKDAVNVDKEIEKNTTVNIFGDEVIKVPSTNRPKVIPKSSTRKYLIPSNCYFRIAETKINNIYRELRDDLLIDDTSKSVPNAVGVLFRVFLEVCLDYYAKKNQKNFKNNDTISQKIPWVVNSLIQKGYDEKIFNNINKVGSAKKDNTYLSIENFHEYVHSSTTQPSSNELKLKWDNLQCFFETLWEDLNKIN